MEAIRSRLWDLKIIGVFVTLVVIVQILNPYVGSGETNGPAIRVIGVVVDVLSALLIYLRLGGNRLKPLTQLDWALILAFAIGALLVFCT